jgi:signal transduction histidine kinase
VGLGLLLTKRIVDAHGGSIAVRSKLGAGTTVHVAVPIEARG